MPERRLYPDHLLVSIGSSQDKRLASALSAAEPVEISGFEVWVTQRTLVTPPGEPIQARFDFAKLGIEPERQTEG